MKQNWCYKTIDFFRHDLPRFFGNVWRFRKALYNHYWFDHHGMMKFMEISLTHMADKTEKYGLEVDCTRLKKVNKMRRATELIKNYNEDLYVNLAEKELGSIFWGKMWFEPVDSTNEYYEMKDNLTEEQKSHNRKVYARATEIEKEQWNELFEILKGQDYEKLDDYDFENQLDGSGLNTWWD